MLRKGSARRSRGLMVNGRFRPQLQRPRRRLYLKRLSRRKRSRPRTLPPPVTRPSQPGLMEQQPQQQPHSPSRATPPSPGEHRKQCSLRLSRSRFLRPPPSLFPVYTRFSSLVPGETEPKSVKPFPIRTCPGVSGTPRRLRPSQPPPPAGTVTDGSPSAQVRPPVSDSTDFCFQVRTGLCGSLPGEPRDRTGNQLRGKCNRSTDEFSAFSPRESILASHVNLTL